MQIFLHHTLGLSEKHILKHLCAAYAARKWSAESVFSQALSTEAFSTIWVCWRLPLDVSRHIRRPRCQWPIADINKKMVLGSVNFPAATVYIY